MMEAQSNIATSTSQLQGGPELQSIRAAFNTLKTSASRDVKTTEAVSTLGSASKTYTDVRTQLAESDVLSKLISIVEYSLNRSHETTSHALRCIGNACIDDDDARASVTNSGFDWAKQCLRSSADEVKWLAVKVLYNICSDYEPAQQRCYRETLHYDLLSLCTSPEAQHSNDRSLLIDLLFWITGHKPTLEPEAKEPLPDDTLLRLLNLPYYHAATADLDDFATLLQICLTFLRDSGIQTQIIEARRVGYVWQMLETSKDQIQNAFTVIGSQAADTKELLKPLAASLMWCLSDIAANPAFGQKYSLEDGFVEGLLMIIRSGGDETGVMPEDVFEQESLGARLYQEARAARQNPDDLEIGRGGEQGVAAACQIIGNLLFQLPPSAIVPLVTEQKIHEKLWEIFVRREDPNDHDTTHSVACFMIQLTRGGAEVCDIMGEDENAQSAMTILCEHETPQIKQDGVKLLRALGKGSAVNRQRFEGLAASLTFSSGGDAPMANGATNGVA